MNRPTTTVSACWSTASGRAESPPVSTLQELAEKHQRVALLYGARDPEVNHARVLLEFLQR
jgi:uncharacterized protein YeaO (DUF488 family)